MDLFQLAQQLEPFTDRGGETFIKVAVEGEAEVHQIPLDSPLAGSIVRSQLAQIVKNGIPTDHQTRTAIEVIRGHAYVRARADATCSVDHQISRKPLAQAVLAVARTGGTKKTLQPLLSMLIRTAVREDIDVKKGPWPHNEDALGKQLSALRSLLAAKGVKLVRHDERPRAWSISPLFDGSDGSDDQVSSSSLDDNTVSAMPDTSASTAESGECRSFGTTLTDNVIQDMLDGVIS